MTEDQVKEFCDQHSKNVERVILAANGNRAAMSLVLAEATNFLAAAIAIYVGGGTEEIKEMVNDTARGPLLQTAMEIAAAMRKN